MFDKLQAHKIDTPNIIGNILQGKKNPASLRTDFSFTNLDL